VRSRKTAPRTIDDYIAGFPGEIQEQLQCLRAAIKAAAPAAEERISYRMPAFYLRENLVYFAAFKDHIGFFPTSSGVAAFEAELGPYRISKGTIRFPLDRPLPLKLVAKIVKFRAAENLARTVGKSVDSRLAKRS
jgi:uncharacterized protein YdhG (YjbR/CyaY superfamily)